MPEPTTVFEFPNGKKWEVPTADLVEGSPKYEEIKKWLADASKPGAWGSPTRKEKGWKVPGAGLVKAGLTVAGETMFPGQDAEVLEELDAPQGVGRTGMGILQQFVPTEIGAESIRTGTDVAAPGIIGGLGFGTGASVGSLFGPVGTAVGGVLGGALGGFTGQKVADKTQRAAGVEPSGASPYVAAAFEGLAPPMMTKLMNIGKGALRKLLGGVVSDEAAEVTLGRVEEVARSYRRMGVDDPALPQLIQNAGGSVPFRNMMTTFQQLNTELPFFRNVTEDWLRRNVSAIDATLAARLGYESPAVVGKTLKDSVLIGAKSWDNQLGKKMDDVFMSMPSQLSEQISIKPIIDELASLGVVNNPELLGKLATGDKGEQLLAGFVKRYGTLTGKTRGGMTGVSFGMAPVGEIEAVRKALGATFKNSESVLSKSIAQTDRNKVYGAMRQAVREHMETLETAGKLSKGSVAKYERAMKEWSEKSVEEQMHLDRLLKETTPPTKLVAATDMPTRSAWGDIDQIKAMKSRIAKDPTYRANSWSDVQDLIVRRNGMTGENFDMPKFKSWYTNMNKQIRNEIFDAEHRALLKDMFTVAEGPWPTPRASGPAFISQQIARPIALAGGVGGILGARELASGAEGQSAFKTGAAGTVLAGATLFFAPAAAQRAMTSKAALKFIKDTATMSPRQYHNYVGSMIGGVINAVANPEDESQYQDALAIYSLIDSRTQLESLVKSLGNQPAGGQ